jgi:CRISPR-associated protein Cas5d
MRSGTHVLHVWGDLACFTRPELKVERFSYPIITPSAARGIFDAIYCKPKEFRWQVTKVEVLSQPSYMALRRNEVKDKAPVRAIQSWMDGKAAPEPLWADGDRDLLGTDQRGRTQRQTMALRDVRYRLFAAIQPWPGFEDSLAAFAAQFQRRVAHGKCAFQPCFGCREFPAYFEPLPSPNGDPPVEWTQDLGWVLYDVFDLSRPGTSSDKPAVSVFAARVESGVMVIPDYDDPAVRKATGRGA